MVLERISYIAGRRSEDTGLYFRLHACETDVTLLDTLIEGAVAEINVRLGNVGGEVEADEEITALCKEAVVCRVVGKWLEMIDEGEAGIWSENYEGIVKKISESIETSLRRGGRARSRRIPPI